MILEQAGYHVLATDDAAEALQILSSSLVHAVVLGEFVDGERRLEVGRTCKQLKPAVPIVVLYRMSGFRVTPDIADEQVELLDDPQFLLDAIGRVLMRKHGSS